MATDLVCAPSVDPEMNATVKITIVRAPNQNIFIFVYLQSI
jgi:hypothetical protein